LSGKINVPKKYHESINFLTISPFELRKHSVESELLPYGFILKNATIFVESSYIFWGASDVIGQTESFSKLYKYCMSIKLTENCPLLVIERVILNRRFFNIERTFEEVDFYLRNSISQAQQISGSGGGGAYLGSTTQTLAAFGGLAHEKLPPGRTEPDIELFIRSLDQSHPRNISMDSGVHFYKFPYHRTGSRARILGLRSKPWMIDTLGVKPEKACNRSLGFLEKPGENEALELDRCFVMKELPEFNYSLPLLCGVFRSWSSLPHAHDIFSILNLLDGTRRKCLILYGDFHYSIPLACSTKLGFGLLYWVYGLNSKLHLPTFLNYARIDASSSNGFVETVAFHGIVKCAQLNSKIHPSLDEFNFNGDDAATLIACKHGKIYTSSIGMKAVEDPRVLSLFVNNIEASALLKRSKLGIKNISLIICALLFNFFKRKLRVA